MHFPVRQRQAELMDNPSLDEATHRRALEGLRRINWWSRTDAAIWKAVETCLSEHSSVCPIAILDVACGGGDLAIRLGRRFLQAGIPVQIQGCDISATAIHFAREQARAAGLTSLDFVLCDALEEPFPQRQYDIVMSSLFLHHLSETDGVRLLRRMKAATRCLLLIDDLRRTSTGYWLAWLGCRVLSRCPVVHFDGPVSVAGAFTTVEAGDIATAAGLADFTIETHWPQRFLLVWRAVSGASAEPAE